MYIKQSYICYSFYVTVVRATQEYKKDEKYYKDMLNMRNVMDAMQIAEEMATSLDERLVITDHS